MKHSIIIIITALLLSVQSVFAVGALYIRELRSTQTFTMMTMKTYDATAVIENQVATTTVDQLFHNDNMVYNEVEATYVFPLPPGAVITQLVYWFNGQKYIANIRERKEAQAAYDATIRRSLDPALLQYFGENTFKLNIAPINKNSDVRFSITYTELLQYSFNKIQYNFLLNSTGLSPKPLERVSLRIGVKATSDITSLTSPTHGNSAQNAITKLSSREFNVTYGDEHYTPDRNYRLEFEYKRDEVNVNVLSYTPAAADSIGNDSFFATWVIPSDDINKATMPRSVVFTADVSSSMEGKRIEQLRLGLNTFVDRLNPQDYFNILLFSTNVVRFRPDVVPATEENIALAKDYIRKNVNAAGLTNINDALMESFANTFRDSTVKIIAFLTDGLQSWGELDSNKIIANVKARSNDVRIFSYAIGNEPSHFLLDRVSSASGGYATYISNEDSIAVVISDQFARLSKAVLANIGLSYGSLDYYDVFPRQLPDLFYGAQVLQLGRYRSGGTYPVTLSGSVFSAPFKLSSDEFFSSSQGGNRSVSRLWANAKINYLLDQIAVSGEKKELVDAVIELSIRFQILTKYTALYSDPNRDKASSVNELQQQVMSSEIAPNPANDQVRLTLRLDAGFTSQRLTVRVMNALGECVATIAEGIYTSGEQSFLWNCRNSQGELVASGMYFIRIEGAQGCMTFPLSIVH